MAQNSLTIAVISPEREIRDELTATFEENPDLAALWTLGEYPGPEQITRIREAHSGCVVFLDFSDPLRARRVASELDQNYPMAVTIAVKAGASLEDLSALMQLGIREVIAIPISRTEAREAFQRASRRLGRQSPISEPEGGNIYAFLPAKPGSGATTVALHSAAAAARLSGQRTLLIDFDLRLGMTSFLLKLHSQTSVLDALALSDRLEETIWDQLVCRRDGLDILGSAPIEFDRHISDDGCGVVLDYARRRYQTICVDLPGEMRHHELETLHRAKEIFLVCTSEVGTLHMAKRKAEMRHSLGLEGRVAVILNRARLRGSIVTRDIEEVLRLPVQFTLPTAESEIVEATHKAVELDPRSPIGQVMKHIAHRMTGTATAAPPEPKARGFLEFFSVTPVRDKVRNG
jgi:pilus assembly protein CpaE